MWEWVKSVFSILFVLAIFILILVLAYMTTKWIGRRYTPQSGTNGSIRVLDKVAVGQERMLMVVQAAGETLLIGVTPQHIETLCTLDAEKLPHVEPPPESAAFFDTFKNALQGGADRSRKSDKGRDAHDGL